MPDQIRLITQELDGRRIAYHSETVFRVQLGRGSKGSYSDRFRVIGNLAQAVLLFNGLNVGNGYKARLLMEGANRLVLARKKAGN